MTKRISKILIANRGEIACRIIRTAKKLGLRTVSVYSEVDKYSRNVLMSDEAYCIGNAASQESYLNQNKIMSVATETKCDAIHPGYGFLSENARFSEFCKENNIIFIGPPASAIRDMGIKSTSKKIMLEAGVPVIPGYHGEDQTDSLLELEAERIGFPVMIKAVFGGGGKGMRITLSKGDFISQLESARRESLSSFGDQSVLLEKFINAPRHVEVQVFADMYGNCIYLNERDCSIQRRHQKVIEEAPAPKIDPTLRKEIGTAAVRAAKAVNYIGAGTVEFIYDEAAKSFYFMEMNTRLQVEHPITEMITNTDLVEWQIKVANGEKLPLSQEEVPLNGHSVEARIYAEDPYNGFLPCAGPLTYLNLPEEAPDVRVETGVSEKDEVSVHYDPMIAKLVVWGENREEAFSKLRSKLLECNIVGLSTNIEFLLKLSTSNRLLSGNINTEFIKENQEDLLKQVEASDESLIQAALGLILFEEKNDKERTYKTSDPYDPFYHLRGFRVNHLYTRSLKFINNTKKEFHLKVTYNKSKTYTVYLEDTNKTYEVTGYLKEDDNKKVSLVTHFEGNITKSKIFLEDDTFVHLFTQDGPLSFEIWKPKAESGDLKSGTADAVAPMPGVVNKVLIKEGDTVSEGDPLMVIIAMKMEFVINSPKNGTIKEVLYTVGNNVSKNEPVIKFEE